MLIDCYIDLRQHLPIWSNLPVDQFHVYKNQIPSMALMCPVRRTHRWQFCAFSQFYSLVPVIPHTTCATVQVLTKAGIYCGRTAPRVLVLDPQFNIRNYQLRSKKKGRNLNLSYRLEKGRRSAYIGPTAASGRLVRFSNGIA